MNMENRPDPDKLLSKLKAEEENSRRGKLKLFFGANPGVGKTYSMLEAARQRKKEGIDIVVGWVETHGRAETAALLEGLETLPRKTIEYKGVKLQEFDLDAALARKPALIIVDELAHSNAPGSRHAKRWQDVEELLDASISVYTTLNVQHWESLNDVVAQITGVLVRETVPDTFLQRAHQIELVDLSPEDLLTRLKEGKVYMGDQAARAADNFFQPGNLIALRELALRHTAQRVDAQAQSYKELHAVKDVWPLNEKLLVCISSSPSAPRVVRSALRIATSLRCEWIVAYVETASDRRNPDQRNQAINTLRLADQLGAETVTLTGNAVAEDILAYARSQNVSKIIMGKPSRPRWKEWLQGSIVNEIARSSKDIDLFVISGEEKEPEIHFPAPSLSRSLFSWTDIVTGVGTTAASTLICWVLFRHVDRANLIMVYLLGLVWVAYRFGRRASLIATVLSVISFDFFFVSPFFSFAVTDTEYLFTFFVLLIVGLLISYLTGELRQQVELTRERALRNRMLFKMSQDLSETPDPKELLQLAARHLEEFYRTAVILLAPDKAGTLQVPAGSPENFSFGTHEAGVAQWVFDHDQAAGTGTNTLAGSSGFYLPLRGLKETVGVLGIKPRHPDFFKDPDELRLIETFASQIGGALKSTQTTAEAGRAEAQVELERLRNLILSSFSYDIREPLADILKKCRRLLDETKNDGKASRSLLNEIYEKAERLDKLTRELPQIIESEINENQGNKT